MPIVDLSHPLAHGTRTYPGFPPMSISDYWDHDSEGWQISQLTFVSSSGTYLDAPLHRHSDGQSVAELSLTSCTDLPGVKIVTSESKIEDSVVSISPERLSGKAALIQTGWSNNWGTARYRDHGDHPGLGQAASGASGMSLMLSHLPWLLETQ
jgi:arylformamidase